MLVSFFDDIFPSSADISVILLPPLQNRRGNEGIKIPDIQRDDEGRESV